ncbi:MAG TPA: hypothetical protein VFO07_02640 [Roseiflexaceae bacterium]|nr:hypothetical protein [Roseiflexaceae bacterium]
MTLTLLGSVVGLILALVDPRPDLGMVRTASATVVLPAGYADFKFNDNANTPTGEKPQSKLWYNDGRWWADMVAADGLHYIYYLDVPTQTWMKTTTALDPRTKTKSDCLWDGVHLYVASGGGSSSTGADLEAKLYRYTYNATSKTYALDSGFPVTIRTGGAETLVLDKDSTGKLWITYTQSNKVWINRSTTGDNAWNPAAAFNPPNATGETGSASVDPDDISTLVAYDGKLGVMWSKHSTAGGVDNNASFYFAYRSDGTPDTTWQTKNIYKGPNFSDDHLNLKALQASGKEIYAVVKTSLTGTSTQTPQILLLAGKPNGSGGLNWSVTMVSSSYETLTRPVLLLDPEHRKLHVFLADEGGGNIYYKQSSMDAIAFPSGKGAAFIQAGAGLTTINDPTSTKQSVNSASGIVILASDNNAKWYAHNYMDLGGPTPRVVFDNFLVGGHAGAPLATQPIVRVQSLSGHTDTSYNGPVSVVIKSGTGAPGAGLIGAATVNAVGGVARFSGLAINKVGTGFRLSASAPGKASTDSSPFDITRGSQTITFNPPAQVSLGQLPFELTATTSSGLPVSYSASGVCSVNGNTLTASAVGACAVTASQVGDESYFPAASVTRSISIGKQNQTIDFAPLPNRIIGDPAFGVTATASSGLPVSFSAVGVCSVAGGIVSLNAVGACTITASQIGDSLFNPAASVARTFVVQTPGHKVFVPIVFN